MLLRNRDPMVVSKFNKAQMRSIRAAAKALDCDIEAFSSEAILFKARFVLNRVAEENLTLPEHDPELLAMVRNAQATWANAEIELPARFSLAKTPARRQVQKHRRRTRNKKPCQQITDYGSYWRRGGVIDRMKAQSNSLDW